MSSETIPGQIEAAEEIIDHVEESQDQQETMPVQEQPKEEHVPLSALQKERRKRQEIEQELRWHKEQMMAKKPVEPEPEQDPYEAATKEDLGKFKQQVMRDVYESTWIRANPEKAAEINEKLPEFLKQKPNLAAAIEAAPNRYEEAWELMDKLTPKQKIAQKQTPVRKDAPGNPSSVPKSQGMNAALDVMQMSDKEYNEWRSSQRKRR